MKNLEALKLVYTALGGSADSFTAKTNAEAIAAIATVIPTATAAELPAVTASNNGQVLTVKSGKWAAADLPS